MKKTLLSYISIHSDWNQEYAEPTRHERDGNRGSCSDQGAPLTANEKGLTLVELLVVVVLIGLIAVVVAGSVFSKGEGAKAELNVVRMNNIKSQISSYRLKFNSYPSRLSDLVQPNAEIRQSGKLFTPYLQENEIQDLWGNDYVYKVQNGGRSYTLTTLGSDGAQGGEGPAQDVTIRP